ncbi:MAG: MFS transporter [Microbacterium sp.]
MNIARSSSTRAIAPVILCQLMLMVDGVIVTVALPAIRIDLGLDAVSLSWVVSAYALSFAGLLLVSGRIGSVIGPRRALLIGVTGFIIASALGGVAWGGGVLIAARALQGACAALAAPSILVLLATSAPAGPERLRAMSWQVIASSAGSALGLVAGGVLTVTAGWRWVMYVNVPIGLFVLVGVLLFVGEAERARVRIDAGGAVASALAMAGIVFGLARAGATGWSDPTVVASFAVAVIAGSVLVAVERRTAHPVLPGVLLRGRSALPYIAVALMPAMMIGFFTYSVLLLHDLRHLDALLTGLAYLPWAASVVIGGRLVGLLVARIGERWTVLVGASIGILGIALIAVFGAVGPLWLGFVAPCFLVGFAPGLVFSVLTNRILSAAPAADVGAASALLQSMQQLGGAVGVATLSTVFATTGSLPFALAAACGFGLLLVVIFGAPRALSPSPRPAVLEASASDIRP